MVAYKVVQLGLTVAASLAVAVLLRSIGVSIARVALVLLVATVAFQLRVGTDPILAFTGLMQSVVIETALSLACFQRWLRTGNRWSLAAAVALFLLVCLTYESAYLFSVFHLVLALRARRPDWRRAAGAALPFVGISIAFLAVASYGRARSPMGTAGPYAVHFDVAAILRTLGEQLFAGLPLSYVAKAPGDVPFLPHRELVTEMSLPATLIGLAVVVAAIGLLALDRRRPPAVAVGSPSLVVGIVGGLLLWLAAAAPIALAHRYQVELRWGLGHIPVFIEHYGVALLFVSAGLWALARLRLALALGRALTVAAAFALGLAAAVTYGANVKLVDSMQAGRETRPASGTIAAGGADGWRARPCARPRHGFPTTVGPDRVLLPTYGAALHGRGEPRAGLAAGRRREQGGVRPGPRRRAILDRRSQSGARRSGLRDGDLRRAAGQGSRRRPD